MNEQVMWQALYWELSQALMSNEVETAGLAMGSDAMNEQSHGDPFVLGLFAFEYHKAMNPPLPFEQPGPLSPEPGGYL